MTLQLDSAQNLSWVWVLGLPWVHVSRSKSGSNVVWRAQDFSSYWKNNAYIWFFVLEHYAENHSCKTKAFHQTTAGWSV